MILGRKINLETDLSEVNKILKNNDVTDNIKEDDIIYVLEDNNIIIGVCKIKSYDQFGVLEYIVISPIFRGNNFGDSLLRATFNYCLRNGINNIFYLAFDKYIENRGFDKIDFRNIPLEIRNVVLNNEALVCNLEYFFSTGCRCKGRE